MYIRTICVLVENEEGNGFYWGSEYGYEQIIKEKSNKTTDSKDQTWDISTTTQKPRS